MLDHIVDPVNGKSELDLLDYELGILNNIFPKGYIPEKTILQSARLESFLIHARNLIYFLENIGQSDDVRISDFQDQHGVMLQPITVDLDPALKTKINKHCAHISKKRLQEKPQWNILIIKLEINIAMKKFLSALGSNYPQNLVTKILDQTNVVLSTV